MRDLFPLLPVFAALIVGYASTQVLAQQASAESSATWRRDTNAFARHLLGEDLRARATGSGKTEDVVIPDSILHEVIGSRVSWPTFLRATPQRSPIPLIPISVIVHEGQDIGFVFLALIRRAGGKALADSEVTQGFAVNSPVVVSGTVDELRVRHRADGKIIIRVNLSEVDIKPSN